LKVLKRLAEKPVYELASEPLTLEASEPLTKAIGLMKKLNAYELLVKLDGRYGLLTTRTILARSFSPGMKVKGLIEQVPALTPEDPLGKAAALMSQYRVRSLPILEKGKLTGILESKSIVRLMGELGVPRLKARHVMARSVVSVGWGESLAKARKLMVTRKVDQLPVLRRGKPEGVLTSTRIVFSLYPTQAETLGEWVGEAERMLKVSAGNLAETGFPTCGLDEPVQQVIRRMLDHESTYIFVEFLEEIHGVITFRDLVALIPEPVSEEVPLYMVGLPSDPFEAEAAKLKFTRAINLLAKIYPDILEARSTVKARRVKEEGRQRYEVDVRIITSKRTYTYTDSGWDLAQIYDNLMGRIKRIVSGRRRRRLPGRRSGEA